MGIAVYVGARARLFDSLHLNGGHDRCSGSGVEHSKLAKDYDSLCRAYILLTLFGYSYPALPLAVAYYIDMGRYCSQNGESKTGGAILSIPILPRSLRLYMNMKKPEY